MASGEVLKSPPMMMLLTFGIRWHSLIKFEVAVLSCAEVECQDT